MRDSSSFECFPRVIWEAMAHSLPVLATSVGSISLYLENERSALIVSPSEPGQLACAIERLIKSESLRKQLIRDGIAKAHENTIDKRSAELVSHINNVLVDR